MSASGLWDWPLALEGGQPLTDDECYMLLDVDFSDDLLKTFPGAATKMETSGTEYHLQDEGCSTLYPPSPPETKPTRAQLASDLLQQLEHQCKQENIFSNWLEEKTDLNIFENINQFPERVEVPQQQQQPACAPAPAAASYVVPQPTEELLREFETVYGAVELTHLTPPQSPPGPATQLLLSYAHQAQSSWSQPPHLEIDIPPVEELLAQSSGSSTPSSPRSSSADEDWSRPKSHPHATDDRRSRKKEQNKNAATRYRQKKKAEIEVLLSEERALRQKHSELGVQRADLQREIRYLKGLMRELFKAKGLIK